jgi:solute carrier family 25 phosphate transporter 23/24/25/41
MAPGESKDERDERVARLWETLDTRKEGHIDLAGLKKGLKKIDHRELSSVSDRVSCRKLPTDAVALLALKNADDMLRNILQDVDTNGDGQIDYNGKQQELDFLATRWSRVHPVLRSVFH